AVLAHPRPSLHALSMEIPAHWFEVHANALPRAALYLWHGFAASTRKTYSTGQKSYIDFCHLNRSVLTEPGHYLPAPDRAIIEWVSSLEDWALQPKTIKGYLSTVCSLHIDEGLSFDACKSRTVCRVICSIKHYHGKHKHNPKQPIMLNILQKLTSVAGNLSNPSEAFLDVAFKTA
ncbi:hypothetical protein C0993_006046, partial [Termitomyces sp. T159_Od127]